jgi:hypothetical protein
MRHRRRPGSTIGRRLRVVTPEHRDGLGEAGTEIVGDSDGLEKVIIKR